jgi:hypothetical protein
VTFTFEVEAGQVDSRRLADIVLAERRRPGCIGSPILHWGVAAWMALGVISTAARGEWILAVVILASLAVWLGSPHLAAAAGRRRIASAVVDPFTVVLDDSGTTVSAETESIHRPWSDYRSMRDDGALLVLLMRNGVQVMPWSALVGPATRDDVLSQVVAWMA